MRGDVILNDNLDPIQMTHTGETNMRAIRMLTLVGTVMAVMPAGSQAQFEGVVKQRTISLDRSALEDKGFEVSESMFDVPTERILALRDELEGDGAMHVEEIAVYMKGRMVRSDMETDEGPMYAMMDLEQGIMRMVQPSQSRYIEITKQDMERMKSMMPDMGGASSLQPEPRETGLSKSINGMSCVAYDIDKDEGTTRVWVSKDNAQLVEAFSGLMEGVNAMAMDEDETDESALVAKYGFPVLTLRLGHDTYEIEETLSVDSQSVSDELFAVPAGYSKMTMADMMGGYQPPDR